MSKHDPPATHRECWLDLPWYVNGTLDEAKRRRIESHLACCARCRNERDLLQRVQAAVRHASEGEPVPQPALDRLHARITDLARSPPPWAGKGSLPARWGSALRTAPGIGFVLALQSAAIVLLAVAAIRLVTISRPGYEVLSDRSHSAPASGYLRVKVDGETRERRLRALLTEHGLEIVAGPSEGGVYTLVLSRGDAGEASLQETAARLNQAPEIEIALVLNEQP